MVTAIGAMECTIAASQTTLARRNREPQLEQSDVDWKPRQRSRGAFDLRWQPGGDLLACHQPRLERRVRQQTGEDGLAQMQSLEQQGLAVGRHRREVHEE